MFLFRVPGQMVLEESDESDLRQTPNVRSEVVRTQMFLVVSDGQVSSFQCADATAEND